MDFASLDKTKGSYKMNILFLETKKLQLIHEKKDKLNESQNFDRSCNDERVVKKFSTAAQVERKKIQFVQNKKKKNDLVVIVIIVVS